MNNELRAALAVALAFGPLPAWALFNDTLELWASENYTHDSNVFRFSDSLSTPGVTRGDYISTTAIGATLDLPVSQQRLQAALTGFAARYRDNNNLDFNGHTARAAWLWSYQTTLSGQASYYEQKNLSSFSNIQTTDRDLVTTRQAILTAAWQATPRWRWAAGAQAVQQEHDSAARSVQDIEAASGEIGLSYVTPLDNSFGGVVRVERGRAPHGTVLAGVAFDNEYLHRSVGGTMVWILTGHSRFDGRVEWVKRTYDQFKQRDYSGPALHARYTWTPTGKLTVTTSVQRDIGPPEDINTSFVLVKGGYIRPRWEVTDKLWLQGTAEYNVWDYRADPLTGASWTHRVRTFGASMIYRPTPKIQLSAGVTREIRTSTLLFGDYDVDIVFIEGRIAF